jgi:hypothetical protein
MAEFVKPSRPIGVRLCNKRSSCWHGTVGALPDPTWAKPRLWITMRYGRRLLYHADQAGRDLMKETPTLHQLGALVSQQISPEDVPQEAWPEIIGTALSHGLAPMLLWVTKQTAPGLVVEPLWTPVIRMTRKAGIQYVALDAARKRVSAALAAAQIPSLWLKGIALAHTIYPQPVLRSMSDLDVLVPFEQRENARQVVAGLGYHFQDTGGQLLRPTEALQHSLTHHYQLNSDSVTLELHFRLLGGFDELISPENQTWFWTQTLSIPDDPDFTILQPEAHLLYLMAHLSLQHKEEDSLLRQYFDLHQLVKSTDIDWDKTVEWAGKLGWSEVVERDLNRSVRYFSTPIPASVFTRLQENRSNDRSGGLSLRFQGKGSRWSRVAMKSKRLPLKDRVVYLFRLLVPPKPYMQARYGLSGNRFIYHFYLYRWFDVTQEITRAMWNRLKRGIE